MSVFGGVKYSIFLMICITVNGDRHQKLILPTTASSLKIIPRVDMPMVSTSSIQSGFSFKVPISVQFPSLMDVAQSMGQTMNSEIRPESVFTNNRVIISNSTNRSTVTNKARINSRVKLYKAIEKVHKGFGRVCLMRTICEVAEVPFMSASAGLLGEVIDLLLTSSILKDDSGLLSVYRKAEEIGRKSIGKGDKCKEHFKKCPISLFKIANVMVNG